MSGIKYNVALNLGNEVLNTGKSITVNEVVDTADEMALARQIHHMNELIPEQVVRDVLENFCKAAGELMALGKAIVLKDNGQAAIRIYPDIRIEGGSISLERAQELDPTVTELTLENASSLVDKAGITIRAKAECEPRMTEILKSMDAPIVRSGVKEVAYVARKNSPSNNGNQGGNNGGNNGGGSDDNTLG